VNVRQDGGCLTAFALHDALVVKTATTQGTVAIPAIGVHGGARFNFPFDKPGQRMRRSIRHDLQAKAAGTSAELAAGDFAEWRQFNGTNDQDLVPATPIMIGVFPSDEGVIDLDFAVQDLTSRDHQGRASFMHHLKSRLVTLDAQLTL